ncbi:MAG: hypothetical protein R3C59_11700 [Planctomycetaceae bacterium]
MNRRTMGLASAKVLKPPPEDAHGDVSRCGKGTSGLASRQSLMVLSACSVHARTAALKCL